MKKGEKIKFGDKEIRPLPNEGIYSVCSKCGKLWKNDNTSRTKSSIVDITELMNDGANFNFGTIYVCPNCGTFYKPKFEWNDFVRKIATCE